jgi:glycerol-3-phosphate acyltransferase PlsX
MSDIIKIAVDAMGGDGSPKKVIDGLFIIINQIKLFYKIFGDKNKIKINR